MVRCRFIAVRSLNHYLFEKALSCLRGAIGAACRGSNVAGAAGGTRSFHPRYRRGKGILHPTFRNPSSSLKNLCPFTSLLAVTGPVPRLSTHRFRPRILFLLFFFVSARTPLLPLCFPSCPTLRAFSYPIPPLFPASVSVSVSILVPTPIPVSSPFLHLLLCHPARIYPSPRAPDPFTFATCFRPLPSMAGPKSVGNGNSKAMAAAQGRGHVVQSIRAADRYLSSGE